MMERSSVQWGRTTIEYVVKRGDRRGTVSIAVEPGGSIVLTAPRTTPLPRLDQLVRQKAPWITGRVRRYAALPSATAKEFVSGESFAYLGRGCRLQVRPGRQAAASLERGRLVVTLPLKGPRQARAALTGWYRAHAQERFQERIALWARRLRVPEPRFRLGEQRFRWGSCTPGGELILNWRIIQAPMSVVDYVIAHELVHLQHRSHAPAFWATLGRVMPDYERRRAELLRRGTSFVW